MVKVTGINLDADCGLRITVTDANGEEFHTLAAQFHAPTDTDIGWIPSSIPEFRSESCNLTDEDISKIASPAHLSPIQQEFLSIHHRLFHLPYTIMLRLAKVGILQHRLLNLRNDLPLCVDFMFGAKIATDQLVSAQPDLVLQDKGSLMRAHVWGAIIFC